MKISLDQPNGFTSHFAPDNSKYLHSTQQKLQHASNRFNPYVFHAGTVAAISGDDFVVVGGDTRLSEGYSIVTRSESKLVKLTEKTILATAGMFADFCQLKRTLQAKLEIYDYKIDRLPSTQSIAHLLSKTLYHRRFFPYYTFNLVAGLTNQGKGIIYGYDAIGSYGNQKALAQGSGAHMILPFLDSEVNGYNDPNKDKRPKMTPEKAVQLIQTGFRSVAERDIYTGDRLQIVILTKDGSKTQWRQLRKD